jgi:hypothetical protein
MPRKKTKSKTPEKSVPLSVAEPAVTYVVTSRKKKIKPLTDDDWALPGRPATDEEIEKMLDEAEAEFEAGLGIPLEKAKALTMKKIKAWKKAKMK